MCIVEIVEIVVIVYKGYGYCGKVIHCNTNFATFATFSTRLHYFPDFT